MDFEFKNPFDEKVISWLEATMLEGRDGCGNHARVLMPQNLLTKSEGFTAIKDIESKIKVLKEKISECGSDIVTIQNIMSEAQEEIEKLKEEIAEISGGGGEAYDDVPLMDGEGNAGTSSKYARGDHRHPSDTNKVDLVTFEEKVIEMQTKIENIEVSPSNESPLANGEASAGESKSYSRSDHVHPIDTTRASADEVSSLSTSLNASIDALSEYKTQTDTHINTLYAKFTDYDGYINGIYEKIDLLDARVKILEEEVENDGNGD